MLIPSNRVLLSAAAVLLLAAIPTLGPYSTPSNTGVSSVVRANASTPSVRPNAKQMDLGHPVALSIEAINTTLPIADGYYDSAARTWTIDSSHAFLLQGSATPIFYGHNKKGVFNKLATLQQGQELRIITEDKRTLRFVYTASKVISPEDVSVLHEKNDNKIILLTCTGIYFQYRQALYFDYIDEQKA